MAKKEGNGVEAQMVKVSKRRPDAGLKASDRADEPDGLCDVNKKLARRVGREEGGDGRPPSAGSRSRGRVSAVRGTPRALCKRPHIVIRSAAGTSSLSSPRGVGSYGCAT